MLEPSNNGQAKKQLDMGVNISASTGVEGPRTVVCKSCASFNKLSSGLVSQNQHLYRLEQILHCGAVTTISWIAPGNNGSIVQNGSKCNSCGLNLPHIPKLPLNCRAVTTMSWSAPGNNGSIVQDGSKCSNCGLHLPHIPELLLHCRAVTTISWIAPGNNGSIVQNGSKCNNCGLHLPHIPKLPLNCRAVTTISWIAPGNNGSIVNNCGLNLPHIPKLPLNCRAVTTRFWIAPGHNGSIRQDGCKCIFFCGLNLLYSHLTLDCQGWHPSLDSPMSQSCHLRDTAKAPVEDTLAEAQLQCSPSWIPACNASVRPRFLAKNFCPKDSRICKSSTVERSGSSVSLRPLGNDTLTRSILEKTHELRWGWVNTWETAKGVEPYHHTQLTGQLDILSLLKKGGSNSGWGWMSLASWHQFYMKLAAFWRMTSLYFHLKKGK